MHYAVYDDGELFNIIKSYTINYYFIKTLIIESNFLTNLIKEDFFLNLELLVQDLLVVFTIDRFLTVFSHVK